MLSKNSWPCFWNYWRWKEEMSQVIFLSSILVTITKHLPLIMYKITRQNHTRGGQNEQHGYSASKRNSDCISKLTYRDGQTLYKIFTKCPTSSATKITTDLNISENQSQQKLHKTLHFKPVSYTVVTVSTCITARWSTLSLNIAIYQNLLRILNLLCPPGNY